MKFFITAILAATICTASFAMTNEKGDIKNVSRHYANATSMRFTIPITIRIDITTSFTFKGLACKDHVTGTLVVEFDGKQFAGIISQTLHHDIKCASKTIEGSLGGLIYDESTTSFTAAEFESTGDEDIDNLQISSEFQTLFLDQVNSQLLF